MRQHIKYHFILLCLELIRVFCARSRTLVRLFDWAFYNFQHPILIIHLYFYLDRKKTLFIRLFNDKYAKFDERQRMCVRTSG